MAGPRDSGQLPSRCKNAQDDAVDRLPVGEGYEDFQLVVCTLVEAEQPVPTLLEYQSRGAVVSVLYGVPLELSQAKRLG
jgi:hypothetical protein